LEKTGKKKEGSSKERRGKIEKEKKQTKRPRIK